MCVCMYVHIYIYIYITHTNIFTSMPKHAQCMTEIFTDYIPQLLNKVEYVIGRFRDLVRVLENKKTAIKNSRDKKSFEDLAIR